MQSFFCDTTACGVKMGNAIDWHSAASILMLNIVTTSIFTFDGIVGLVGSTLDDVKLSFGSRTCPFSTRNSICSVVAGGMIGVAVVGGVLVGSGASGWVLVVVGRAVDAGAGNCAV